MDPKKLIESLKMQHRQLQADLGGALKDAIEGVVKNESEILAFLNKFKADLKIHINLENDVFYPDFLAKKLKRGEDITEISKFVDQMKQIGYDVNSFLEKYDTPAEIEDIHADFAGDLKQIIAALNVRIETEEEGVFDFYLLM